MRTVAPSCSGATARKACANRSDRWELKFRTADIAFTPSKEARIIALEGVPVVYDLASISISVIMYGCS